MKEKSKNPSLTIRKYDDYLSKYLPKSSIEISKATKTPEELGKKLADLALDNLKELLKQQEIGVNNY